jgi:hypothetical protein
VELRLYPTSGNINLEIIKFKEFLILSMPSFLEFQKYKQDAKMVSRIKIETCLFYINDFANFRFLCLLVEASNYPASPS